ncbi:hypothetical protein MMC07_000470 [Pseudocyphellaria aurata]|nr:hypothetical protein [Pseudocyphellaria aurata]
MERDMAFKSMRHLKDLNIFEVHDRSWWKVCRDKVSSSSSSPDRSSDPVAANPTEKNSDIQPISIIRTPSETPLLQPIDADIEANLSPPSDQPVSNSISQPDDQDQQLDRTSSASQKPLRWTSTLSYYANMGGLRVRFPLTPSTDWSDTPEQDAFIINTKQLSILVQNRHINIDNLSNLSIDTTVDKSKGDLFTKGLAILQVLRLIITVFIRLSKDLAVSQLEILALAFGICSILTYGFCWKKPQDVRTAITIPACSQCRNVT